MREVETTSAAASTKNVPTRKRQSRKKRDPLTDKEKKWLDRYGRGADRLEIQSKLSICRSRYYAIRQQIEKRQPLNNNLPKVNTIASETCQGRREIVPARRSKTVP